jgi:hypothetical protein
MRRRYVRASPPEVVPTFAELPMKRIGLRGAGVPPAVLLWSYAYNPPARCRRHDERILPIACYHIPAVNPEKSAEHS